MLKGKTMKTLKEIESEFMSTPAEDYDGLFESYQDDPRAGVVKLLARYRKKAENLAAEKQRIESLKQFEYKYRSLGLVAGIDEVGRGPLAGPVVACAVILPENEPVQMPMTHGFDGKNYLGESAGFDHYGHRGIGVAEMAWAIRKGRPRARLSGEYGLHCQEILQGMDIAAASGKVYEVQSRFEMKGLKPGYFSGMFGGIMRGDAEASLMD